ncbi:MAG TPA: cation:dicarboxylase symporter family transporter [Gemmatimonadaceae bacterium]|jgi:Na+/H+-dicarboxylate symporter
MRVHRVVIGLIAGLVLGSAIGAVNGAVALRVAAVLQPIGDLWVNAIRMTIVPLVVALLFVSVAARDTREGLGRLSITTGATFVALLLFACVVALLIVPALVNDMKLATEAATALRSTAQVGADSTVMRVSQLPGFGSWVTGLVPANVIKSAADGAMLPLIVFTVLFALAARRIEAPLRTSLIEFFTAVAGATTTIVDWIIAVAPIGVFALVTAAASRAGTAIAGATAYYIIAICAAHILLALLTYPIASMVGKVPLGWFTRAVLPAQAVALSSSSSLASLPALVEGSRALGQPVEVSGFALPLAVSTFKLVTPVTWLMSVLFLAKLYGVPMTTGSSITIVLSAVAISFATPGVPQGAQLVLAPILVGYGIPPAGIALLIAADTIPDLFATMANVTGDFVAGTVIARLSTVSVPADVADDVADPVEGSASSGDA